MQCTINRNTAARVYNLTRHFKSPMFRHFIRNKFWVTLGPSVKYSSHWYAHQAHKMCVEYVLYTKSTIFLGNDWAVWTTKMSFFSHLEHNYRWVTFVSKMYIHVASTINERLVSKTLFEIYHTLENITIFSGWLEQWKFHTDARTIFSTV